MRGHVTRRIGTMSDVPHPPRYEKSDADPRLIGALALGVALFLLATPYLLRVIYPGSDRLGGVARNLPEPPAPRLQIQPKIDLERLRSYEYGRRDTFGWADRDRQIGRIPIEKAMQLLAERGLPGWPSGPSSNSAPR
jgi:hypothetical protein